MADIKKITENFVNYFSSFNPMTIKLNLLIIPLFFLSYFSNGQEKNNFTAEEKAYLFHIVKKSPILEKNIGRYFEYKGPMIEFASGDINYDSIESIIINQPNYLFIRSSEISKSPKGLLSEAANKMALWELNKMLLAKRLEDETELPFYQHKLEEFENILTKHLPNAALKEDKGLKKPHKKLYNLLDPSLSLDDKVKMIETYHFLNSNEQLGTLSAINLSINEYVKKRTFKFYTSLGGEAEIFENILVAAGDGSNTTGLLEEREKDEQGRWNKGLPKAVGLFPYQLEFNRETNKGSSIEPLRYTKNKFKTVGNNKITNLHFDVWGYNSKKQTTVVIERNGLTYHLFGSGKTRFLSPDSSFSDGATFQSIINQLKTDKIKLLTDKITGKKGFDYWISHYEKKKTESAKKINKYEREYSEYGYTAITTKNKMSRKDKKERERMIEENPNQPLKKNFQPKTDSNKDKRSQLQEAIVRENEAYKSYLKYISDLKYEKENAQKILAEYQLKLNEYNQLMGEKWAAFTYKDGVYTFEDSTQFDMLTQEFQFKENNKEEDFEIRLLSIPYSCLSKDADEVMLHIHLADAEPTYDARLKIQLEDAFDSDKFTLNKQLITKNDSVAVKQLFESIMNKKLPIIITAKGNGIGKWNGQKTIKDENPKELTNYPGVSETERQQQKMDSTFSRLRKTELIIKTKQTIQFEINSYTDPVNSNLTITNPLIQSLITKNNLSKNDVLSGYRTGFILKKIKQELNILAGEYLDPPTAKIVIDRLNTEIEKSKVLIGKASIKLIQLLP